MHASIVKSVLTTYQIARDMNELIQERSHIHVSNVKSALAAHQIARDMNELIKE